MNVSDFINKVRVQTFQHHIFTTAYRLLLGNITNFPIHLSINYMSNFECNKNNCKS